MSSISGLLEDTFTLCRHRRRWHNCSRCSASISCSTTPTASACRPRRTGRPSCTHWRSRKFSRPPGCVSGARNISPTRATITPAMSSATCSSSCAVTTARSARCQTSVGTVPCRSYRTRAARAASSAPTTPGRMRPTAACFPHRTWKDRAASTVINAAYRAIGSKNGSASCSST